jgi:hypothetical protein
MAPRPATLATSGPGRADNGSSEDATKWEPYSTGTCAGPPAARRCRHALTPDDTPRSHWACLERRHRDVGKDQHVLLKYLLAKKRQARRGRVQHCRLKLGPWSPRERVAQILKVPPRQIGESCPPSPSATTPSPTARWYVLQGCLPIDSRHRHRHALRPRPASFTRNSADAGPPSISLTALHLLVESCPASVCQPDLYLTGRPEPCCRTSTRTVATSPTNTLAGDIQTRPIETSRTAFRGATLTA